MATKTPIENGQNTAPVARGKAEAMASFLARKGSPRDGARYNRLVQKFEVMWQKAPDALKEKYASRARTDLAPSERPGATVNRPVTNATLNKPKPAARGSVTPPPIAAPGPRTENPRDRKDRDTVPAGGERNPPEGLDFNDLTKAPAIPAGGVNSVGDGVFENGKAVSGNLAMPEIPPSMTPAPVSDRDQVNASLVSPAQPTIPKDNTTPTIPKDNTTPTIPKDNTTPFGRGLDAVADAIGIKALKTYNSVRSPFRPDVETAKDEKSQNDAIASRDARKMEENSTRLAEVSSASGKPIPPSTTTPPPAAAPGATAAVPFTTEDAAKERANPTPQQPPVPRPSSTLREPDDFTPGPGKEMVGVVKGRPTYASADSLYGKATNVPGQRTENRANDINQTIANTPETADSTKPVMIGSEQTIEQRRADYQTRSNTPQSRDAAGATLESMGVNANASGRTAPPIAGPRGPASQIQPKGPDHNAIQLAAGRSREAAEREGVRRQAEQAKQPTMNDVNRRFTPGTEEHRAAAYGVNPTTGAQLTKDDTKVDVRPAGRNDTMKPGTSRITDTRPATPEQLRTGNAGAPPPTIQRPQIARRR